MAPTRAEWGMRDRKTVNRARALRRDMTVAERRLWERLRGKRLHGWRFRRQADCAGYVVDFLSLELGLVIEVDGPIHDGAAQRLFDEGRTKVLEARGLAVLRLDERLVREEIATAVALVVAVGRRRIVGLALPSDVMDEA